MRKLYVISVSSKQIVNSEVNPLLLSQMWFITCEDKSI